jgi:hypothetical protein
VSKFSKIELVRLNSELILKHINCEVGYLLSYISQEDLSFIQSEIFEQYLHNLQRISPKKVNLYKNAGMKAYHNVFEEGDFDHGSNWSKPNRVLGPEFFKKFTQTHFYRELKRCFGDFLISDEENFGWPNVYWRLVRPGYSDIGPVHADKWFWDLGHGEMPSGYTRLKIWLGVHTESGENGLRVLPCSRKHGNWKYHGEIKGGLLKPVLDEDEASLDMLDLPLKAGQFVLFHDELLHGGMPNLSDSTRVSLEFTLLIPSRFFDE